MTRKVASLKRQFAEGGSFAVILAYAASQIAPNVPPEVQAAGVGLGLTFLNMAFSALRNAGVGGFFTGAE